MTRLLLLPAVLGSLLLFALFSMARARPITTGEFFTLISPSADCGGICPLAINPGSMTSSQAVRALEDSSWVADIVVTRGMEMDSGYIQWTWNGEQPAYFDTARQGSIWFQHGVVQRVEMSTRIPFGELWLHTGIPQTGRLHGMSVTPPRMYQMVTYERGALSVRTEISCPLRLTAYWFAPVILRVNSPYYATSVLLLEPEPYELPDVGVCGAG
jgi:hypothetical protein